MSNLRNAMRQHTAAAHEMLEAAPLMRAFASGKPSVDEYRDYLTRQFVLHRQLEAALTMWVPPQWRPVRLVKAHWLLCDLCCIGAEADHQLVEIPSITSVADALGILYVLEGGTLGMQVVRKRFQQHHPALNSAGRFMHGYGADTAPLWRAFIEHLETLPARQWPQAIIASGAAFAAFHRVFLEPGPASGRQKIPTESTSACTDD